MALQWTPARADMACVPGESVPQRGVTARDPPRGRWWSAATQRRRWFWSGAQRTVAILCLAPPRAVPWGHVVRELRERFARGHQLTAHQVLPGQALARPVPRGPGAREPQGYRRMQRAQGRLGRGKACRVTCPRLDVWHHTRLPILPAALGRADHMVQAGAAWLSGDPAHALALGKACRSREVVARSGDTAVAVGGPGQARVGALPRAPLLGSAPARRAPPDLAWDGRAARRSAPARRRGRILGVDASRRALCQVARGG